MNIEKPAEACQQELEKYKRRWEYAQDCINQIDDYFEYRMESQRDQQQVREYLAEYSKSLMNQQALEEQ